MTLFLPNRNFYNNSILCYGLQGLSMLEVKYITFLGFLPGGRGMNSYKIFTVDYLIFSYKVRKLWHSSTPFSSQNQNYYQIELMTVNMTNHQHIMLCFPCSFNQLIFIFSVFHYFQTSCICLCMMSECHRNHLDLEQFSKWIVL